MRGKMLPKFGQNRAETSDLFSLFLCRKWSSAVPGIPKKQWMVRAFRFGGLFGCTCGPICFWLRLQFPKSFAPSERKLIRGWKKKEVVYERPLLRLLSHSQRLTSRLQKRLSWAVVMSIMSDCKLRGRKTLWYLVARGKKAACLIHQANGVHLLLAKNASLFETSFCLQF